MLDDRIAQAIERNDLDELLRLIDACCDARDWDALFFLRDRARQALETGRQLWPAASHAEYRVALEAPAAEAARVLVEDTGHFAIGPLAEVAASTHTWAELAPHVRAGPVSALAAHERVVRGEHIDAETVTNAEVLNVPLALARWEPEYVLPIYRADRVEQPGPEPIRGRPLTLPATHAERVDDQPVVDAFRDVVHAWTARSEGTARVVCIEGDVAAAIGALGAIDVRSAWVDAGAALSRIAWAGAGGGRHGRRRGAATGRDLTWAAAGALAGFEPGERVGPDELGDAITSLRWYVWNAPDVSTGWVLRFAVEDPVDGIAWACDAVDRG
jgi:hypothetical protein